MRAAQTLLSISTCAALISPSLAAIAMTSINDNFRPQQRQGTILEEDSGTFRAFSESGQSLGKCTLKHTSVDAHVSGDISRVSVKQHFENPYSETIEAIYTFPLSDSAAVDEMEMRIGDRIIKGSIKKRDEARRIYQMAKARGKSTALLDQERTNIFTQSVANIPPHSAIDIEIKYTDILCYRSGAYSFVFPMVVGPRFMPGRFTGHGGSGVESDTDQVPDASRISPRMMSENMRAGHDITMRVSIDAGMSISNIESKLHKVDVVRSGPNSAIVSLQASDRIPNRDFVLDWTVAGDTLKSGCLTYCKDGQGFFNLMLVPPKRVSPQQICPRELNFIVDRSGSQAGLPLEKAKETVLYILDRMNSGDTFQIMSFSNTTEQLFSRPQPAAPETLTAAKKYIAGLTAGGGTEMWNAVSQATTSPAQSNNRLRIFTIMTDGFIGDDNQVIDLVRRTRGVSRWFSFGTGNSVNRNLIDGIAKAGGGEAEYVLLNSKGDSVAKEFYDRISTPVLTDIKVNFDGLSVVDVEPEVINDVWEQRPLYITGTYSQPGKGTITLTGIAGEGKPYVQKLAVDLPAANDHNSVLPSIWARAKVDDLTERNGGSRHISSDVDRMIQELGLQFHLLTPFTSFVAVDESGNVLVPASKSITVPVEAPNGMQLPEQIGRVDGPRDTNLFQVEPSVIDERHYTSGRTERSQRTSPAGGAMSGAAVGVAIGALGGANPRSNSYRTGIVAAGQSIKIVSDIDLTRQGCVQKASSDSNKLDEELRKTLSNWVKAADDSARLQVRLEVRSADQDLISRIKALPAQIVSVSAKGKAIIAKVPVRQIKKLAQMKEVLHIGLADED